MRRRNGPYAGWDTVTTVQARQQIRAALDGLEIYPIEATVNILRALPRRFKHGALAVAIRKAHNLSSGDIDH